MIFVFADCIVDDRQRELEGPGGVVPVEPRVLDTLLFLLRHRDRVVSRQELVDRVWDGDHVTDSAVTRSVMAARRAIGDQGSRGGMIRTYYGRGYRFIEPVEVREDAFEPRSESPEIALARTEPRTRTRWLAVAGLVLGLVPLTALRREAPATDFAGTAGPPARVEVLSESGTTEADHELLALSLADSLSRHLERSADVEVVRQPARYQDRPNKAGGTATVGPDYRLVASIEPSDIPGHARFEATLDLARRGAEAVRIPLGHHVLPLPGEGTDPERFVDVREALAGLITSRFRASVNLEPMDPSQEGVARLLFLQAAAQWQPVCDRDGSATLLRRSLELDPGHPAAWWTLAGHTASDMKHCAGPGSMRDTREALDRAIALDQDSPTAHSIRPVLLLWEGENARSWKELEAARKRYPDDLALRLALATALRYAGFLEESRALHDRLAQEFPALPWVAGSVPHAHLYQLDWEAARLLMPAESEPFFRFYRAYLELMVGEVETAVAILEPAYDSHPGDLYGRLCQALLASILGEEEEARILLAHLIRQRTTEALDAEVTFEIARLLVMAKDDGAGLVQLAKAVEEGFFCTECVEKDPALERLHGDPRFEAVVSRANERHRAFARRFDLDRGGLEPATLGGGPSRALERELRAATRYTLR